MFEHFCDISQFAQLLHLLGLSTNGHIFPLLFSTDVSIITSAVKELHLTEFEFLGIVKLLMNGKLGVCFALKTFKILTPSESEATCGPVEHENSLLDIYHKNRAAPTEWIYYSFESYFQTEADKYRPNFRALLRLSQLNPFNHAVTNFSIDMHILQSIFSRILLLVHLVWNQRITSP